MTEIRSVIENLVMACSHLHLAENGLTRLHNQELLDRVTAAKEGVFAIEQKLMRLEAGLEE